MQKDKVRVYVLARELNMESKDLLDMCRSAGLDLKNQLSSLDPEQKDMIVDMVKSGGKSRKASSTATAAPVIPTVHKKSVPKLDARPRPQPELGKTPPPQPQPPTPASPAAEEKTQPEPKPAPSYEADESEKDTPPSPSEKPADVGDKSPAQESPSVKSEEKPPEEKVSPPSTPVPQDTSSQTPAPPAPTNSAAPPSQPPFTGYSSKVPNLGGDKKMRDLSSKSSSSTPKSPAGPGKAPSSSNVEKESKPKPQGRPGPGSNISTPPPIKSSIKPKPKEPAKSEEKKMTPKMRLTPEMLEKARKQPIRPEDVLSPKKGKEAVSYEDDDVPGSGKEKDSKKKRKDPVGGGGGGIGDRNQRKKEREERARERRKQSELGVIEKGRFQPLEEDSSGPQRIRDRIKKKRDSQKPTQPRKDKVSLEPPITVRSLSEALGMKSVELLFKLRAMNLGSANINTTLEPETAEEIALEAGIEVEIKRPLDVEDQILEEYSKEDDPNDLEPRAPIVTVMGHVDHGKTSLLDKIRKTNVVDTEAGGITQVIRAWRVEHAGHPITFLDTPGHEAFTKMRARGAQVTDVAVIVVAADDGVMPQTEEAINHSKAAGVSLVVAINKVDVPNANLDKTRQQLYSMDVLPDNMGGETPFVETSAATGKGIDDLLDNISLVAELKELKANPNKPAKGICLEAMLSEGEGVQATFLVQDGTLKRGDTILCGSSYGRIRQMYSDLGKPVQEAGPSVPVRITGLDVVPQADDPFIVVPEISTAREIAEKRRTAQQESAFAPKAASLDIAQRLSASQISELKVILKADFRGSIEAIRKELEKLQHEEVGVRILHAAIGGISESDVQLALTSPDDTMIIGFNAVPDERARSLAEEKGIPIREHNIIYELTNDIRSALEGKLKPKQEIVHLGRAVVRDIFKISRVGTIAGCYVTQGILTRSSKVRLIRGGVIVYPPPEKTAGLDSLKRFKDDVAEVREGFECGLKIAGYDDVKVDDVIEAYRVEEVQRTLE